MASPDRSLEGRDTSVIPAAIPGRDTLSWEEGQSLVSGGSI